MAAYFHPDMFRNDLGPGTACDCGLPACRSGWPFQEQDRQEARAVQSASGKRDWRQVSDGSVR